MEFNFSALKKLILPFMLILTLTAVNAASNVIDVQVTENVYEVVNYDPLTAGSGQYFDANEQQSIYSLNGTIFIINKAR